jgi:hypothetical protein
MLGVAAEMQRSLRNARSRPVADTEGSVHAGEVTRNLAIILLSGAVPAALLVGYVAVAGSAEVIDQTSGVVSAVITNSEGTQQPLRHLWAGHFYAIPRMEGTIEIRCRNGLRKQWGYVTSNEHTKIKVVGGTPCARIVDAS